MGDERVTSGAPEAEQAVTWADIAVFPDCAWAALGDVGLSDENEWDSQPGRRFPSVFTQDGGHGMIYGAAEADGIAVEVGTIGDEVVGARIEFVNDVEALLAKGEGAWEPIGQIRVGADGAVALDKQKQDQEWEGGHPWRHDVPLPAGSYSAQAFMGDGDHLGIRLVRLELC